MESYNGLIKPGLMLAVFALIGSGLFGGSAYAGDKDEQSREVMVDCDKGQSIQDVLWQYFDDKKPLEIIVKGTCGEENEVISIERDKVLLEGDEDVASRINAHLLVERARNIEIGDNMELSSLFVNFGEVSIEAERSVTIHNDVFIIGQSSLTIDTHSDDDDGVITTGLVTIDGPITIERHSLLSVHSNVFEGQAPAGQVYLNGMLFARLQSSMDLSYATVNDIVLEFDSHALLGRGLLSAGGVTSVQCDQQSRAWEEFPEEYPTGFNFEAVKDTRIGETCDSNIPD